MPWVPTRNMMLKFIIFTGVFLILFIFNLLQQYYFNTHSYTSYKAYDTMS